MVKLGAPGKQYALIRLNFSDGANLHNCKAPFSKEKVGKRHVCEAKTDWEGRASAAANSSARLFQLLPSCLSHSTDTAGLRLPPHDTNAVPAARLKRLPQNEVNSVHVLRWMWTAETTQDPAATTSLTVSPRVKECSWLLPAGSAPPGQEQGARGLTDGPTATQWLMLQVVSHLIGERSQVAVDSLYRSGAAPSSGEWRLSGERPAFDYMEAESNGGVRGLSAPNFIIPHFKHSTAQLHQVVLSALKRPKAFTLPLCRTLQLL